MVCFPIDGLKLGIISIIRYRHKKKSNHFNLTSCFNNNLSKVPMETHVRTLRCFVSLVSGLFSQNLKCRALLSNIFSTSSMGSPLVSGTHIRTKNNPTKATTPKMRKVQEVPITSVKVRKDCATMRLETQFAN